MTKTPLGQEDGKRESWDALVAQGEALGGKRDTFLQIVVRFVFK
jgi:hypothetical protein